MAQQSTARLAVCFALALLVMQPAAGSRQLLQGSNCPNQIPQCESNRCYLETVGGKQQMVCERCKAGYTVSDDGLNCICKPGFYHTGTTLANSECKPCEKGMWCPGGLTTAKNFAPAADKGQRFSCKQKTLVPPDSTTIDTTTIEAEGLTTKATRSRRHTDCVPMPGYYLKVTSAALQIAAMCSASSYSPGYGRIRKCLECQAGTTENPSAGFGPAKLRTDRLQVCTVPPGRYLVQNVVRECPAGTFRGSYSLTTEEGSRYCFQCPPGVTTNSTRSTNPGQCIVLAPGSFWTPATIAAAQAIAQSANNTALDELANIPKCPYGTYFPGGVLPSGADQTCITCPFNTTTESVGSASVDDCVVPPGYYIKKTSATTGTMEKCPNSVTVAGVTQGTYRAGWVSYDTPAVQETGDGSTACTKCGPGILSENTDVDESLGGDDAARLVAGSSFSCYIVRGWGMVPTGVILANNMMEFKGELCENNTYGVNATTYGLQSSPCKPCQRNLITTDTGRWDYTQCVNPGGFGYTPGGANQCAPGSYNEQGSMQGCVKCPPGRTTDYDASRQLSIADCYALPGYGLYDNGTWNANTTGLNNTMIAQIAVMPCPVGYYSPGLAVDSKCVECPGSSSTMGEGSTSVLDCTKCKAGYGKDSTGTVLTTCGICPAGTYQPGYLGLGDSTGNSGWLGYGERCIPCETTLSIYLSSHRNESKLNVTGTTYRQGAQGREECIPKAAQLGIDAGTKLLTDDTKMDTDAAVSTFEGCMAACRAAAATGNKACIVQFEYGYFNQTGPLATPAPVCRYKVFSPSAATADITSKDLLFYKMLPSDAIAAAGLLDDAQDAKAKAMSSGLYARLDLTGSTFVVDDAASTDDKIGVKLSGGRIVFNNGQDLASCKKRCDMRSDCWGFTTKTTSSATVCNLRGGVDVQDTRSVFINPADPIALNW